MGVAAQPLVHKEGETPEAQETPALILRCGLLTPVSGTCATGSVEEILCKYPWGLSVGHTCLSQSLRLWVIFWKAQSRHQLPF